jgi:hypothetical protein
MGLRANFFAKLAGSNLWGVIMALGQLIEGEWVSKREQEDTKGRFLRPSTTFRERITADGSSGFKAESRRYTSLCILGLSLGATHRDYAEVEGLRGCDRAFSRRSGDG